MSVFGKRTALAWIAAATMFLTGPPHSSAADPAEGAAPPSAQSEAAILIEQRTGERAVR
ncbi:hypothetical protein [Cohnella rhizosphaerae]|uniref:Uncharacterized protein n=1 Tax=Cohnella rhizosphaerae TaxID=1457232 RepID=A0A9X4QVB0_9BACL|nr:hypothetical protein [Cohnella rhizosphaerae]MDG0812575.1 hypothetical protein [Cohnella rhizosphaerae]